MPAAWASVLGFALAGRAAMELGKRNDTNNGSARRVLVGILLALPLLVLKLAIGGIALALLETLSAKMRIFRVPEFLATAFLLAVIGLLVHILLGK